jgi:2-methylcitrate dehydratase PrpD
VPEAFSGAHDRADHGAGGARGTGGTWLFRRGRGSRYGGGHRADGDNQQHRRSHRHHDGAIFHSIPFCVALALFRDPRDPASFDDTALSDTAIRAMCGRVTIVVADPPTKAAGASIVSILLKDARSVTKEAAEFNGTPARPLDRAELRDKFMTLTRARYGLIAGEMFERLQNLENETDLGWVGA